MEISAFYVSFLAEIGLDIFVVCFLFLFSYDGKKWKLPLIGYLAVMTPLYLHLITIPAVWSFAAWCLLIPFGLLIFIKNIQATAYFSILKPKLRQPSANTEKKTRNN
jgi:hypothetical protein